MHKLLDVTDRSVRRLQLAALIASGLLIGIAGFLITTTEVPVWATVPAMLIGIIGIVIAGAIRQRWDLEYKGHQILFENNPITGERLFLDGGLVSRGGVGKKMELRAPIRVGDGAGEEIMALVDAGIFKLRLRVYAEGAGSAAANAPVETSTARENVPATPVEALPATDASVISEEAPPATDASAIPVADSAVINASVAPMSGTAANPASADMPAMATSVAYSGAIGKLNMARRVIEFIGSVITIITTAIAVILWLLQR